jgi:hypothetical protein
VGKGVLTPPLGRGLAPTLILPLKGEETRVLPTHTAPSASAGQALKRFDVQGTSQCDSGGAAPLHPRVLLGRAPQVVLALV